LAACAFEESTSANGTAAQIETQSLFMKSPGTGGLAGANVIHRQLIGRRIGIQSGIEEVVP
jgi:hypothetical protein